MRGCLACAMVSGQTRAPGGNVFEGHGWLVQHALGPVVPGTLALKTLRHCLSLSDLSADEAAEHGPLLRRTCTCVMGLTGADRVQVEVWSHGQFVPGHLHFVVRPGGRDGPQVAAQQPAEELLVALVERARDYFASGPR